MESGLERPHDVANLAEWGVSVKFSSRLVAMTVVGTLASGAIAVPASAHKRTITNVSSSVDEEGVIRLFAFMDPEEHAGTMKLTLKKENAAGDWVVVKTKRRPTEDWDGDTSRVLGRSPGTSGASRPQSSRRMATRH